MPDYQKMYHILFNQMSKTIEMLQNAQCEAEEIFMCSSETIIPFIPELEE